MASRAATPTLTRSGRIVLAGFTLLLATAAAWLINGSPVVKDSAQNLQMAIDLSHTGTMSDAEQAPFRPSMYREPLPVAVSAAMVSIVDAILGRADSAQYFSGTRVRILKYQNIVWLAALGLIVVAATHRFTGSLGWSIIAGLFATRPFLSGSNPQGVNDLYTELPAAFLITTAAFLLVRAVARGRRWDWIVAGVCFGLLALTKAAMLYVFVGVVLVLLGTYVYRSHARREHLIDVAVLCAALLVVVVPWMGRNWVLFHQAQISQRGGLVLYTRALMDQVTPTEYKGTFYVWARPGLRPIVGSVLGFGPEDLSMGGRLQRLNDDLGTEIHEHDMKAELAGRPSDAITLHRQARAERVRLQQEFEQRGADYPEVAADSAMSKEAVAIIKKLFWQNLALAVPLMWRCAPLIFPALLLTFGYSLWSRSYLLTLFSLPGLGLVIFYALVTHFEPRPAIVAHSTAVIAVVVVLSTVLRHRFKSAFSA